MSIDATYNAILSANETLETGVPAAGSPTINHAGFNKSAKLKASGGTYVGTKCIGQSFALVAGAKTIDLTALVGTNGVAVDATGLKLKAIHLVNTGANLMIVKFGAANPYPLLADSTWRIPVAPSGSSLHLFGDSNAAVAGGAKNIDVSGAGTQTLNVFFVFGT